MLHLFLPVAAIFLLERWIEERGSERFLCLLLQREQIENARGQERDSAP